MNPWWKRPEPRKKGEGTTPRSGKPRREHNREDEAASVRSIDVLAEAEELAAQEKSQRSRGGRARKKPETRRTTEDSSPGPDRDSDTDSDSPNRRVRRRRRGRRRQDDDGATPTTGKKDARRKEPAQPRKARQAGTDSKMALYLDIESLVAADESFDAAVILEHLKSRGKVLLQRCYADWRRHDQLKEVLHGASMELIDVPVHQGSRTGAEMKMVVDALEACYQRDGIDTFVLVSGRRELLPLVAKLREADRRIVGIGSRDSSPELVDSCDEFLYLEDLLGGGDSEKKAPPEPRRSRRRRQEPASKQRESSEETGSSAVESAARGEPQRQDVRREGRDETRRESERSRRASSSAAPEPARREPASLEDSILQAVEAVEREGHERLWSSLVQQAMRRGDPELNERRLGYDGFSDLLEDAERKGLLELARDERTGLHYVTTWRGRSD